MKMMQNVRQYEFREITESQAQEITIGAAVSEQPVTSGISQMATMTIDVEKIKSEAFADGQKHALESITAKQLAENEKILQIVQKIEVICSDFAAQFVQTKQSLVEDSISLSLAIAKKVIGTFLANTAGSMIKEFLSKNLPLLYSEPKVSIKVSPEYAVEIAKHVASIQQTVGSSLSIDIIPTDMQQGDCTVEFSGAKISKNSIDLLGKIENFLQSYCSSKESVTTQNTTEDENNNNNH